MSSRGAPPFAAMVAFASSCGARGAPPDGGQDATVGEVRPGCEDTGGIVYARCLDAARRPTDWTVFCDDARAPPEILPLHNPPVCWPTMDGTWLLGCREPGTAGRELWNDPSYLYCVPPD